MSKSINRFTQVGIGVECCVIFEDFVLLSKRSEKVSTFKGFFCFPGGSVNMGENLVDASN